MSADERTGRVAGLLREAGEAHHVVYRILDGADDDWASWYSEWLTSLSELPEILGARPVRSALTATLVRLDRERTTAPTGEPWPEVYARAIVAEFSTG